MTKTLKKGISVLLVVVMLFTGATGASATDLVAANNSGIIFVTNVVNGLLNVIFKGFTALFPKNFPDVEEYYNGESENFYKGMDVFLDDATNESKWYLGFGKESVVPENLKDGSK